jgi:hypothetical protein
MAAIDVAILANSRFKATIPTEIPNKKGKYLVDVLQKLTIVKDLKTGNMGCYVTTIIPTKYSLRSKGRLSAENFPNYGNYNGFSGWILYSFHYHRLRYV